MITNPIQKRIYGELCSIPIIDTHEHLWYDEVSGYKEGDDILREYLIHYMRCDVISAGLERRSLEQVLDPGLALSKRWAIVEPYGRRRDIRGMAGPSTSLWRRSMGYPASMRRRSRP